MDIQRDGSFSHTIPSEQLQKGLRPSKRVPRNSGYLTECIGLVGRDGTLQSLDEIIRIATTAITDPFPFPQIFVFTKVIIVCGLTVIYEWISGSLSAKLSSLTPGSTWEALDFFDYIYLSNGRIAVTRNATSKVYAVDSTVPSAMSLCNFNSQVLVGGPDSLAPAVELSFPQSVGTVLATGKGVLST